MFDERLTAQVAARLLHRAGGSIGILKLMKLMYLVDRESYDRYGYPVTGDRAYSLPLGPVLSTTYKLANGEKTLSGYWGNLMSPRQGNIIKLCGPITENDLDQMSVADMGTVDSVFDRFGDWAEGELVNYTHDLEEYIDPEGSSVQIPPRRILTALGKTEGEIKGMLEHLEEMDALEAVMQSF